jgi:hypothetical protein
VSKSEKDAVAEFQRRTREMLRAQQDAYLAALKTWRENLGKGAPAAWPQQNLDGLVPTPNELAEASYAFAAKLFADQRRFMEAITKAMTEPEKKTD